MALSTCTGDSIVQIIERTECIGNSLTKINSNFQGLDEAVCNLQFNLTEVLQADGILKGVNQEIVTAVAGVDYSLGTAGLNGILKSAEDGTITAALSSVDFYVPRTALEAYNTTIMGTLSVSNTTILESATVKGAASIGGGLGVTGDITTTGVIRAGGDVIAFNASDAKLKDNVSVITNAVDKISSIRGVTYVWNTEKQKEHEGLDVGVLAQEVEKILPSAVIERENGYKAVNYIKLIPLLIESIKELKAELNELKKV
jgi:hypothetical protein